MRPMTSPQQPRGVSSPHTQQPAVDRITPLHGHPLVVGVTPGSSELVIQTAAVWAEALADTRLYCAYVDTSRCVVEEHTDGTVVHRDIDPDVSDDTQWRARADQLTAEVQRALAHSSITWDFRYLAGSIPRALTHLARAVDAAAIVVGTRDIGVLDRARTAFGGSVAHELAIHQHRPVLVVPRAVVDWEIAL